MGREGRPLQEKTQPEPKHVSFASLQSGYTRKISIQIRLSPIDKANKLHNTNPLKTTQI